MALRQWPKMLGNVRYLCSRVAFRRTGRAWVSSCPLRAVRSASRNRAGDNESNVVNDALFAACSRATNADRKRMYLGLDVSSKVVGYSVLDERGECITCGAVKMAKISEIGDAGLKLNDFFSKLVSELGQYEWAVTTEDCLRTYAPGGFHSRGLIKLAQFNAVAQFSCRQVFGVNPWVIHPTSPRAFFNLHRQLEGAAKQSVKERVHDWVRHRDPDVELPETVPDGLYDACDAYLLASYSRILWLFHSLLVDEMLWDQVASLKGLKKLRQNKKESKKLDEALMKWLRCNQRQLAL